MLRLSRPNTLIYYSSYSRKCSTEAVKPSPDSQVFRVTEGAKTLQNSTINKPAISSIPIKDSNMLLKLEHLEPVQDSKALRKSLSFDEVPGPQYLRYLSKFWSFLPVMGTQVTASAVQYLLGAGRIIENQLKWGINTVRFRKMLDQYGPVVRLHGPFGGDVVILSKPEHAALVFENEGRYPIRSGLDCLEKYRIQFRHFKRSGPFVMYGPEWDKLRKTIEVPLHTITDYQHELIKKNSDECITRIYRIRNKQDEVPCYFRNEINKWALECMCCISLNKRLGFLDPSGLSITSEPARVLDSLNGATNAIRRCESGVHMWKFFNTPAWNALVKNCDQLGFTFYKYIHKIEDTLHQKKLNGESLDSDKLCLVETLFLKDGLLPDDVLTVLLDMVLIGVNSITHSVAFLLYNLARNPRAQLKLYKELVKNDGIVSPYLQACIKESLRLNPPLPILSRVLSKDALIHNYRIPRGTYILIDTHASSMREEYFEDAHRFKPERWSAECYNIENESVYGTLPFGYGQKSSIARVIAEVQVASLISKIIQKFRVEYHYGELTSTNKLLAATDRPLKFTFVDRL